MAKVFTAQALPKTKLQLLKPSVNPLARAHRQERPRGPKWLAIVPAQSSAKELRIIRSLALLLLRRQLDVSIFVAGSTLDDLRLMSQPNIFVSGPVEVSELGQLLQPHDVGWILTGFDEPLFGHPLIESARNANAPVAYLDWSMGEIAPRAGDLAIHPDQPLDRFTHQVISWIERI